MNQRPVKQGRVNSRWAGFAIPKLDKAKKAQQRAPVLEATIQAQVEGYCEVIHLICFHIPDAMLQATFGPMRIVTGAQLGVLHDAAEAIRGFPDCLIFDPRFPWHVLPLELKKLDGKVSRAQRNWGKDLASRIPRSFEEARRQIDGWRRTLEKMGCCQPPESVSPAAAPAS
jgi:hypothetical protein